MTSFDLQGGLDSRLLRHPRAEARWRMESSCLIDAIRPLRRAIERELVDPLSRFIASQMLSGGDVVEVERDSNELVFYRRPRSDEKLAV